MAFNLKKILRALLFSTSDALSIKDIQAVITRYHTEQENLKKAAAKRAAEDADAPQTPPTYDGGKSDDSDDAQTEIEDIMAQVPTLLTATQIREAMEEIAAELEESGDVCRLLQSSSGFKLAISKDYAEWVRLLRNDPRPQRLTRAALETLAIIAYRQPVTRAEIEAIRGVNADGAISRLTEKELVFISGRADLPGRPVQFSTTRNFLDFVGVNSLEELPASDVLSPNQITEWIRRVGEQPAPTAKDVGLDENSAEHNQRQMTLEPSEPQTATDEAAADENSAKIGDAAFPSDGAETSGSEEEYEPFDDCDASAQKEI